MHLRCAACGSVLFLFTTSCQKASLTGLTGLRNTKRSSCWPQAAQTTNETCPRLLSRIGYLKFEISNPQNTVQNSRIFDKKRW